MGLVMGGDGRSHLVELVRALVKFYRVQVLLPDSAVYPDDFARRSATHDRVEPRR